MEIVVVISHFGILLSANPEWGNGKGETMCYEANVPSTHAFFRLVATVESERFRPPRHMSFLQARTPHNKVTNSGRLVVRTFSTSTQNPPQPAPTKTKNDGAPSCSCRHVSRKSFQEDERGPCWELNELMRDWLEVRGTISVSLSSVSPAALAPSFFF